MADGQAVRLSPSSEGRLQHAAAGARLSDDDFDEQYYAHGCGIPYQRDDVWFSFFARIADRIVTEIGPRRVLDAGCALGLLVEMLRAREVEAYGLDISSFAIARVDPSVRAFCWRASVSEELPDHYDLIVCQEVFPHVAPGEAEEAIANFCRHTDDVLFASTPADPTVRRHVNLNPPEHWAELFARHGFYRDLGFDASFVTPWAVRYRRMQATAPQVIRQYERRLWELLHERDTARSAEAGFRATQDALRQASDTIVQMERSWFWRARRVWARLSGR